MRNCSIKIMTFSICLLISSVCFAMECPMELPNFAGAEDDVDRDGIPNSEDQCCFVATLPEHNSVEFCPYAEGEVLETDLNMNGVYSLEEGTCCVMYANANVTCKKLDSNSCTGEGGGYNGIVVPCDMLLSYTHMAPAWYQDENGNAVELPIGDNFICHTVEDYDGDGDLVTIPTEQLVDNCPSVSNRIDDEGVTQSNVDGDQWGDACDLCSEIVSKNPNCDYMPDSELQCNGLCLQYVYALENQIYVQHYCSHSGDIDEDHDLVGDECGDNCLEVSNPEQANSDDDSFGDLCDNCPLITNEEQINEDGDELGDECDECKEDPEKVEPGICGCNVPEGTCEDGGIDTGGDAGNDTEGDTGDDTAGDTETETGIDTGERPEPPDMDGDGYPDHIDTCPTISNKEENEIGSSAACEEYKGGAFSCECDVTSSSSSTSLFSLLSTILKIFL